ncbi:efflux RND transporter periplasmic adaptor subunit [Pseudomonas gingeri]|uniref:efflux RND transporter periplasmic adaptor subunit n=1 Tax=Pseudomonas gingeri TaxID=117681 RepID=UPI0015A09492|nr:efflux RND transporter periplasmic adaptor subunit [Pseudomonas gingeri]NWD67378.1 efflux RND transporter periplasmic adaptor subunit [Pseudomonas gingeri]
MSDTQPIPPAIPATEHLAPPAKSKRPWLLRLLVVVVVLGAISWGSWYRLYGRWYATTDNAYAQGNVVQVTPQIPGTVVSIGADDGDLVQAGAVLVRLDPSDSQLALASAEANLASIVRKVRGLYSSVDGAEADWASLGVTVDKARADYERRKMLATSGAIPAEELAHAHDSLLVAQSTMHAARQRYQTSKSLVDDTVLTSHPEVQAAVTTLRTAFLGQARATVVAPVGGYIAKRSAQLGQRVQPGEPLMAVVPLHQVWIEANFTEMQLTDMRIGQAVEIHADVYGNAVCYDGRVESLGIGTGSAFALLPAQNATGNWIKIVQRLPVRIALTRPEQLDSHPLRIGLSTSVSVDLHDTRGALLSQQPPTQPVLDTTVYRDQLAQADALIERIIQANSNKASHTTGERAPDHS